MAQDRSHIAVYYLVLLVCQMAIDEFANLTQYVSLSLFPVLVLCLPLQMRTVTCMFVSFAAGVVIDYLSGGLMGITPLSLVPVALMRATLIRLCIDPNLVERKGSFSVSRNGFRPISVAMILSCLIYFAVYVPSDCAGEMPFWFVCVRVASSTLVSYLVGIPVMLHLSSNQQRR